MQKGDSEMTKRKRITAGVFAVIGALLLLWAGVFITDYICVSKAQPPVFAKIANDGGDPYYKGPGYGIEIKYYDATGNIEEIIMYSAFDTVINAVILCY